MSSASEKVSGDFVEVRRILEVVVGFGVVVVVCVVVVTVVGFVGIKVGDCRLM